MIKKIEIIDFKGGTKAIKEAFSAFKEAEMQDKRAQYEEERRVWIWSNFSEYSKTGEYPYPLCSFEAYLEAKKPLGFKRPKTRKEYYEEALKMFRRPEARPSFFKLDKEKL